ncbi:MAG: hypothetical protein HYY46_04335, partial [Deltaproteobacteria bacterium]|nr:hypothetical protein [Deltaproteobacteria bacterium]
MVNKLLETSQNKNILALQIDTATSPENLITQVEKIAKVLKKEEEALLWKKQFLARLTGLHAKLSAFSGKRAVVHLQAQPFSRWAGLSIVQVIRSGELPPKAIADAVAKSPDLVVDILHFPTAKTIAENAKCGYVQVINFPGVENTKTLEDIFDYNVTQLLRAF